MADQKLGGHYTPYFQGTLHQFGRPNLDFDADLTRRNPAWGLRRVEGFASAAADRGLAFEQRRAMPANNLMLLFRRR
jgi:hypothetical protein